MEKIPGFTPRRIEPGEDPDTFRRAEPKLHYFGCGAHREVLYPGELASPTCPKCGPGDLSYDGWGERLRPSWRP
jgi:hypothetical protein